MSYLKAMTTKPSQPFENNKPNQNLTNRMRPSGDAVRLRIYACGCGPWFPFGSQCVQAKLGVPVAGSCIRTNMRSLSGYVQLCAFSPLGWRHSTLCQHADESAFLLSQFHLPFLLVIRVCILDFMCVRVPHVCVSSFVSFLFSNPLPISCVLEYATCAWVFCKIQGVRLCVADIPESEHLSLSWLYSSSSCVVVKIDQMRLPRCYRSGGYRQHAIYNV